MHPNKVFRTQDIEDSLVFVRDRGFGTLILSQQEDQEVRYPLISHVPFLLSEDGTYIEAHLVRSNPILKCLTEPHPVTLTVTGSDAYISPDWYGVADQVPTWNYVAVHLKGTLLKMPQEEIAPVLARLSADMEQRLLPKKPWTIDKMTPDVFTKMTRQIVPVRMDIKHIEATWKLSQNKSQDARDGAIEGLSTSTIGSEIGDMRALMSTIK